MEIESGQDIADRVQPRETVEVVDPEFVSNR